MDGAGSYSGQERDYRYGLRDPRPERVSLELRFLFSQTVRQRIVCRVTSASLPYLRTSADGVIIEVFVVPLAKKTRLLGFHGGYPKVALAAPPAEGRANVEFVDFLRELLGLPSRSIEILRGESSRRKTVLLRGIHPEKVAQLVENAPIS